MLFLAMSSLGEAALAVGVTVAALVLYNIWNDKRRMAYLLKEIRAGHYPVPQTRPENSEALEITFDATGFAVVKPGTAEPVRLPWIEVARVTAFHRERMMGDCICMKLARADGTGIELDEEMASWADFCGALPGHLPGSAALHEWIFAIGAPSQGGKPVVLYEKPAAD